MTLAIQTILLLNLLLTSFYSQGATNEPSSTPPLNNIDTAQSNPLTPQDKIKIQLQLLTPTIQIKSINATAISNLYYVKILGGQRFFASADGQHLIIKDQLLNIASGQPINLTMSAQQKEILDDMKTINKTEAITYLAQGKTKAYIYVFTDADCPACSKIHADITNLNQNGIEIRFLGFPREGLNTKGHKKLRNAWCAKDRPLALTQLAQGKTIPEATCEKDPIAKQYQVGLEVGVSGTPFLVLEDGRTFAGYKSANWLIQIVTNKMLPE